MGILTFSKQANTLSLESQQEWLETNRLGSYASSTLLGCPTRKYHGLLVASLSQPLGKFVLLSRFEEYFQDRERVYPLSIQRYANHVDTEAFAHLNSFSLGLGPSWLYECGSVQLTKAIMLIAEKNTVLIKYSLNTASPHFKLTLRPFLAYRSFHELMHANTSINPQGIVTEHSVRFFPYFGMPPLFISSQDRLRYIEKSHWYYEFAYPEEKARGYDYIEDLFSPGDIELSFEKNKEITIACSLDELDKDALNRLWKTETRGRQSIENKKPRSLADQLETRAANQLILGTEEKNYSIIAGYHWFTEWGRDAMVSLPGLTLYSGKEAICLQILKHFAAHEDHGLIPNRITPLEQGKNEYDSIDASLLFCWALQQYYLTTKDVKAIKSLWPTIKNIIHYYRQGTRYDIKQAENELIYGGSPTIKLTWMDVMLDGVALTPRNGAAVEINALWYNAVCFAKELAGIFKEKALLNELNQLAPRIKKNFIEVFWSASHGYLYDFVNDQEKNIQLRPNQLFAAALPYCVLDKAMASSMIKIVQAQLLTPYGLRTLAASDPSYQSKCEGDQKQRDKAYHQGTVWPWLLGMFADACVKFFSKKYAREVLQPCLNALTNHVNCEAGIQCVSEIFDGDAPHTPRGCIQQAWSVAEIIRTVRLLK